MCKKQTKTKETALQKIQTYNERLSLTHRHTIALDGLTCRKNQEISLSNDCTYKTTLKILKLFISVYLQK